MAETYEAPIFSSNPYHSTPGAVVPGADTFTLHSNTKPQQQDKATNVLDMEWKYKIKTPFCVHPPSRRQRRTMHRRVLHSCPRNHGSIILPPYAQAHQRTTVANNCVEIATNNFPINLYNQHPSLLEKNVHSPPHLNYSKRNNAIKATPLPNYHNKDAYPTSTHPKNLAYCYLGTRFRH
jgi:hypothetical protein